MADNTINVRIKDRSDTEANWTSKNPVLLKGERAITDGTGKYKIGDGKNTWGALPYYEAMTSADRTKLNGIASGANKTTVDSSLSSSSTNPVQNKVVNSALAGKSNTNHTHNLSTMINTLSIGSSTPTDEDYFVSQYVGGGTTTTTYHRRPVKALLEYIKGKLAKVATSGSYNDLSNKPTIPSVGNGTITIKQAGAVKGSFTTNQSGATTIELTDNNTNTWRDVIDNLTSTATDKSLSAKQGKLLNNNKAEIREWSAQIKCATWSRLCYVEQKVDVIGSSFILNISGTRYNVVYNDTFVIKVHHPQHAIISKISGSTYSTGIQVRVVSDSSGNCYVEMYENVNGATNTTTQTVYCSLIDIACGEITTYTSFTNGSSIPTGFTSNATITTNSNSLQGNLTWGEITGKPSTYTPSSHTHTISQITDISNASVKKAATADSANSVAWGNVSGKPSTFTPSSHNHDSIYLKLSGGTVNGDIGVPSGKASIDGSVPYAGSNIANKALTAMNNYKTYLGSMTDTNGTWWNMLSTRHRNGNGDGSGYGMTIYSALTGDGSLYWNKQISTDKWVGQRTILDSSNYNSYAPTKAGGGASGTWGISITGNAATATKLGSSAGSATQPVYFSDGKPVACSYTINASVPSGAKFTDTNTWRGIQNVLTSTSTTDSLSAAQGKVLNDKFSSYVPTSRTVNGKALSANISLSASDVGASANGHTHSYAGSSSVGGAATSANKLNTNAGSATKPVYFSNGIPVAGTYTLGNACSKTTRTLKSVGNSGWKDASTDSNYVPDMSFIAYWNGAYSSSGGSNLAYCNKGAFGTAATKNTDYFATSGHTHNYVKDAGNNSSNTTFAYSKAVMNYGDYTWLAGWNGYELRAVNKNQFATAGHTHNYAGSSSAGGSANSAVKLATARTVSNTEDFVMSFSYDGSANSNASLRYYNSRISVGNTNNYPYHRFAKIDTQTGSYIDKTSTFLITQDYNGGGWGIVRISLRTNNSSSVSAVEAKWLVRCGLNVDCVQIGLYNVFGKTYADAFFKTSGTYTGTVIRNLASGARGGISRTWTLTDSTEANSTTTSDKKTSTESYASTSAAATTLHSQAYTSVVVASDGGTVSYANSAGNATKVNGHTVNSDVPANAKFTDTVYSHPTTSGNKHIPSGGSSGQILRWSSDGTAVWGNDNNTTYTLSSITGTLAVAKGGTGSTTAAGGRAGLGAVGFVCQKSEPSGQNNGDLWFKEE